MLPWDKARVAEALELDCKLDADTAHKIAKSVEERVFASGLTRISTTLIRELVDMGHIVSFCTAGYRCGRTGKKIMDALSSGQEGCFCKLNAVLTFQEWLEDFATGDTKEKGSKIIDKEMEEIRARVPADFSKAQLEHLEKGLLRIRAGERDLYF